MRKWQSKMHPAPNSVPKFVPKLTVSRVGKAQKTVKNGLKTSKNAHFQPILVEVTGFEPTTSWSRTASAQALLVCRALRFRRTIAAAPPFPTKMLRLFAGAP